MRDRKDVAGFLSRGWLNVVAAIMGGIMMGFGVARFVRTLAFGPGLIALMGLLLMWYAVSDRRKSRGDTPESESHGDHTIE
ncbi:MAG TPA: hypothetical protein VFJ16_18055 [Longimicrobium sp.]|nr:hypothetical protein [Longimicrobium sp.]